MSEKITLLNPTASRQRQDEHRQPILGSLRGKNVAFIDNTKPNFGHLVDDLADLLVARYGVKQVIKHRKKGSVPVPEVVMRSLVGQCDAVITGSGD